MAVYGMSPIAVEITEKARQMASEAEARFVKEPSPHAAGRFLDTIAELGPDVFAPTDGSLEWALAIATRHLENVKLSQNIMWSNYEFLRGIANLYGLRRMIQYYDSGVWPPISAPR